MTIQEFKIKYKAVLIELEDEPTRLVFSYKKKVILIKCYDFLIKQEYVVTIKEYINYSKTFDSLSDVDLALDTMVDSDNVA
jgi:hypothetical protein